MALQTSGPISFSEIQTELGGTDPISMSEYYSVGGLPSSGVLSISDFYGESASSVNLRACTAYNLEFAGTSTASLTAQSNGTVSGVGNLGLVLRDWLTGAPVVGAGNGYDIKASMISGITPSGTIGSWESLSSARTWSLTRAALGSSSCVLLIEIRDSNTLVSQGSAQWTITAERQDLVT